MIVELGVDYNIGSTSLHVSASEYEQIYEKKKSSPYEKFKGLPSTSDSSLREAAVWGHNLL